jgi:ketosteroid isomerase-like protein
MDPIVGEAVAENNRRFVAAAARGDAAGMAAVYAADAELLAPDTEPLRGRESIERFWQGGIEMGICAIDLETLALEASDGIAYEAGRWTLRMGPACEEPTNEPGKYVVLHRRQADGTWRRAVEIFNWNAPRC